MGLMHNLFRKIDENVQRRRSKRSRPSSEPLSNIELLEQRIALTANIYNINDTGDTAGYVTIMLDESGDDLYIRQTLGQLPVNQEALPVGMIQYADNPSFSGYGEFSFPTNTEPGTVNNEHQEIFVGQGVPNHKVKQ